MRPYEKQLLDGRLKHFMEEVIPDELLPYLPCLTPPDKQEILAKQTNHGPIKATYVLVDRLKRRDEGFPQFVQALRSCGGEHTALLLDPYYKIKPAADNESSNTNGTSGLGFKMIGTAIDVETSGSLFFPEDSGEQSKSCCEMEESVAERYKDQKSEENKKMRKELQEHLPQGAVFVNTAKGSIISTFRLSSEKAAVELWEMYTKGTLQSILETGLVENALKDDLEISDERPKLAISLCVERFNKAKKKLKEIATKQENESLFSLSSEKENGSFDDDDFEIVIEIPPVFLGREANALSSKELKLREYQKELAEPAIQGKNTIICAPTNSGKTYVAIGIVKQHLDSFSSNGGQPNASANMTSRKQPRVVFIVSTVNLVTQQKEKFEEYLCDKYTVGEICGASATEIPLKYLLQSHHVVVMTAQILVNALNSENKEERVELKDISMLLFDECHHAHKEHPYNSIMENYLAFKLQPGLQPHLPKIIGLTASLGTGKAKSVEKAEEHIILVSANLDAEVISTVQKQENKEELKKYANVPDQELCHIPKNEQDPFEKIISKVMDQIELQLKMKKGKCYKAGPPDKAGQQYRQWIEEFYKDSAAAGDRFLVTYAEHLREYHVALTLNTSTRMKNARRYLQKYFDSLDREKFTEIDEKLEKLYKMAMQALGRYIELHGEPDNPLLRKLKELLLQNYEDAETPKANALKSTNEEDCEKNEDVGNEDGREDLANAQIPGSAEEGNPSSDENAFQKADDKAKVTQENVRETESAEKHGRETSDKADDETFENTIEEDDEGDENVTRGKDAKRARVNCDLDADGAGQDSTKKPLLDTKEDDPVEDESYNEDLAKRVDARSNEEAECTDEVENGGGSESDTKEKDCEEVADCNDSKASGKNAHQAEWSGPKGILFTKTRESTEALLDWIKETKELNAVLRPEPLVGGGDGSIGMTQNEQEKVIKRFKTGEKNLLLATSVAEEGLDISDCNYVIRYDMMGNEISSVQSRGRVRADKGKYTVLVGQSVARKREKITRFREILMTEALNKVQRMNPEKFILTVKDIQHKCYRDRYLKKHMFAAGKSEFLPNDVTFFCRKCKEVVCQAHDVRRINGNHYVIINRKVRDTKVDEKDHPRPKKFDDIEMNRKIFCKECHEDWGVMALICNMEWMCIKIKSFVLEFPDRDRPRRMYKQWKDLPFAIKEASLTELLQHGKENEEANGLLDVDLSLP